MSWYVELAVCSFLATAGWNLGSISSELRGIRRALGEPDIGAGWYSGGGLRSIARAIRETRGRP